MLGPAYDIIPEEDEELDFLVEAISMTESSPAEIVLHARKQQQQREKERAEAERAQQLDKDRRYFEKKPFMQIYREYAKTPIWVLVNFITYMMVMVFGRIPKDTDRPDYKQRRLMIEQNREDQKKQKKERSEMEYYYKKYGKSFKYSSKRFVEDIKWRRKRRKAQRNKPKTPYVSKLTPEQEKAHQKEMRALYKRYHVTLIERFRRWYKATRERIQPWIDKFVAMDKKPLKRTTAIIAAVIMAVSIAVSIHVTACAVTGKVVNILGYSVLKVETGSMEPALHVGDYIVIKRCDPENLSEGDIVSFYSEDPEIEGMLVTHRISSIKDDGTFITCGDANPVSDSVPVKSENILGVFKHKSRFYMWLGSFADTSKLFLLFVLLPLTLLSIYELRSMILIAKQAFSEKKPVHLSEEEAKADYKRRMREAINAEKARLASEHFGEENDEVNQQ